MSSVAVLLAFYAAGDSLVGERTSGDVQAVFG